MICRVTRSFCATSWTNWINSTHGALLSTKQVHVVFLFFIFFSFYLLLSFFQHASQTIAKCSSSLVRSPLFWRHSSRHRQRPLWTQSMHWRIEVWITKSPTKSPNDQCRTKHVPSRMQSSVENGELCPVQWRVFLPTDNG